MEGLVHKGHSVFLLTQQDSPVYHQACTEIGVKCYAAPSGEAGGLGRIIKRVQYLVKFIKSHNIDIVYCQLEPANLIGVITQYFVKAKVVLVRHHIDEIKLSANARGAFISKWMYRLARNIVVVSAEAKDYMVKHESIDPKRIHHISLGYNFNMWKPVDVDTVKSIKEENPCQVLLIAAARLIKAKRVDLAIDVCAMARKSGIDARLIILGKGEDELMLKNHAAELGIDPYVRFYGYVGNVLDYMAASDLFLHYSLVDSSPLIVKESSLAETPVIVCRGVGDSDSYIEHGKNGFLVDRENPVPQSVEIVKNYADNVEEYREMPKLLKELVLTRFNIKNVVNDYEYLNEAAI